MENSQVSKRLEEEALRTVGASESVAAESGSEAGPSGVEVSCLPLDPEGKQLVILENVGPELAREFMDRLVEWIGGPDPVLVVCLDRGATIRVERVGKENKPDDF